MVVQVNGRSVIGMPHNKAVALIKNAAGKVTLAISRYCHAFVVVVFCYSNYCKRKMSD